MITVACVRHGRRYSFDYVERLRRAVERHAGGIPFRFVCLTDQPERGEGIEICDIGVAGLYGWWSKMLLFRRDVRDLWDRDRVFYFDLDTVICGPLAPLFEKEFEVDNFAICENFTRRHGNDRWPCMYGSCVMVFGEKFDDGLWQRFKRDSATLMRENEVYGDQRVIELLADAPRLLQNLLPENYLISYRAITSQPMPGVSIINFGGGSKPDNCNVDWVREQWV